MDSSNAVTKCVSLWKQRGSPGIGQAYPKRSEVQQQISYSSCHSFHSGLQRQRRFWKLRSLFTPQNPWHKSFFSLLSLIGPPLKRFDSEVVDLVYAMEDMERGLSEMAQSVEHMQEMLKRSPMVQALAQRQPEVRAPSALRTPGDMIIFLV